MMRSDLTPLLCPDCGQVLIAGSKNCPRCGIEILSATQQARATGRGARVHIAWFLSLFLGLLGLMGVLAHFITSTVDEADDRAELSGTSQAEKVMDALPGMQER